MGGGVDLIERCYERGMTTAREGGRDLNRSIGGERSRENDDKRKRVNKGK